MTRTQVVAPSPQPFKTAYSKQRVASVLLVVNASSGLGRTVTELQILKQDFHNCFGSISQRTFVVTTTHEEVIQMTQAFLLFSSGPWLILAGGGGGTTRAMVQGLMNAVNNRSIPREDVHIGNLRLGSGNLLPRHFDLPPEPAVAMRAIHGDILSGRSRPCCVYRSTFHYPDNQTDNFYGVTMAGIGQIARVPADIQQWRARHPRLMRWGSHRLSLERLNTLQYMVFSLKRILRCLVQPQQAELIELRHNGQREQFRLLFGLLLNFDFPQLPFHAGCTVDEPRLRLCLLPHTGRWATLTTLQQWSHLDACIRTYDITPDAPVEIEFLEQAGTTIALDEDTFVAPNRVSFGVESLVKVVTGSSLN